MIAYLDSSVLLRILLNEKHPFPKIKDIEICVSSELLRVECLRVFDRLRHTVHLSELEISELHAELFKACSIIELVKIAPLVLGMAGQPFPSPVRTLDALHLASALLWSQSRQQEITFLTHDVQLGTAARGLGFTVEGV